MTCSGSAGRPAGPGDLVELLRAVLAEVDLSASAVLRQALSEYVGRHGYDGVAAWFTRARASGLALLPAVQC